MLKKLFKNQTVRNVIGGLVFLGSLYVFQNKDWIIGGILVVAEVAIFLAVVQKTPPVATLRPTVEVDSDLLRIVIEEVIVELYGQNDPRQSVVNSDLVRHLVSEVLTTERYTLEKDGVLVPIKPDIPDWMSSNTASDETPDWLKGVSETPPDDEGRPKRTRKLPVSNK